MKNMKKLISILSASLLGTAAFAQSGTPIYRFQPLLSGFNVNVTTNTAAGLGVTNTVYSTYGGQIVHSLTNDVFNGTLNTNLVVADAFKIATLGSDVNGDINANAYVTILVGNTNYIPLAVTNSFGQYYVTNWALGTSQYPNWMYPATTNLYPAFTANSTNTLTVTLYRAGTLKLAGGISADLNPATPMWETTSAFSFTVAPNGLTPVCVITNLPIAWLQGARHVYATITAATGAGTGSILVNQLGIVQPTP
jgi:hypothetical protein